MLQAMDACTVKLPSDIMAADHHGQPSVDVMTIAVASSVSLACRTIPPKWGTESPMKRRRWVDRIFIP